MEVVALLFISVLYVYSLQIYIEMETLLSGLFSLSNRNISIYILIYLCHPSLFPVVSSRSFVLYRARKLKIIFSSPTCLSFALILKECFTVLSQLWTYTLGQRRIYLSFFFFLMFCQNLLAQLVACWSLNMITVTAYSISSDKSVLRVWIKVSCASVAL